MELSDADKAAISLAAARGIEGTRSISTRELVSAKYRIPNFVKKIGSTALTLYFDERRRMMGAHNAAIKAAVVASTEELRSATRGQGVVVCPDCEEEVAWGNLLSHRLDQCKETRV